MPYRTNSDLPPAVQAHLPPRAQAIYREAFCPFARQAWFALTVHNLSIRAHRALNLQLDPGQVDVVGCRLRNTWPTPLEEGGR